MKTVKFKGNSMLLTFGKTYNVISEGTYFYTILTDNGTEACFSKSKFE